MIIGFVGFMGSGKGTAGDYLSDVKGFTKEAFAKPVKDAIAPIFGWDRRLLEGDTDESRAFREAPDAYWSQALGKPFTPRLALQLMGTESGRNVFHPEVWVHSLIKRIDTTRDYVITDVRFPNEMKAIINLGGLIINVQRGPLPEWYEMALYVNTKSNWDGTIQKMPSYPDVHYSEWAWIGSEHISSTITNDAGLIELKKSIDLILKNM